MLILKHSNAKCSILLFNITFTDFVFRSFSSVFYFFGKTKTLICLPNLLLKDIFIFLLSSMTLSFFIELLFYESMNINLLLLLESTFGTLQTDC